MQVLLKSLVGVVVFVASHVNSFVRGMSDKVAGFWMVTGWAWSFALLFWDWGWAALSVASWLSLWAWMLVYRNDQQN